MKKQTNIILSVVVLVIIIFLVKNIFFNKNIKEQIFGKSDNIDFQKILTDPKAFLSDPREIEKMAKRYRVYYKLIHQKRPKALILYEADRRFAEKVKKLSSAERRILNYYIEGHETADIPDLAFISIHTVKKHN